MTPTLDDGDLVLIRAIERAPVGALVVVRHPKKTGVTLIKRVASRGNGNVSVGSDNPYEGTDSRQFGPIDDVNVLGIVTFRWAGAGQFDEVK